MKSILRRLFFGLIATAALAVSAGVLVVALAYALFALAQPHVGSAGAAAVVALAGAVLMGLLGLGLALLAKGPKRKPGAASQDPLQVLMALMRERPIVSTSALIAAALVAIRNPAIIASVVKAILDQKSRPQNKKAKP